MFAIFPHLYQCASRLDELKQMLSGYHHAFLEHGTDLEFQNRSFGAWGVWVFDPSNRTYVCADYHDDEDIFYDNTSALLDEWRDGTLKFYGQDNQSFFDDLPEFPPIVYNDDVVRSILNGHKPCSASVVRRF